MNGHRPPPRPAAITTAAVLLIVVGADTILAGGVAAALTIGFPLSPFVEVWLIAGGLFLVPAFFGGLFLRTGRRLLAGRLGCTSSAASTLVMVGVAFTVASGMLTLASLVAVIAYETPTPNAAVLLGGVLFAVLNAVAVLSAGVMVGNCLGAYAGWQRRHNRQ